MRDSILCFSQGQQTLCWWRNSRNLHCVAFLLNENLRRITSPFLFWFWSLLQERKVFFFSVHQCGCCQLWSFSACGRSQRWYTKSLMMLLIIWEVFTFGEVYLGTLIFSQFQFSTKMCLSPYPYVSTVCADMSALWELQFHQMPLDLHFPCRGRFLETS